ncbi:DNA repair protein-like protein Rad7 [Mollisia scopiformis]|uniref:DNA repair protein-like protein Rad7 n=1 Tax=Mollisia scopiformis TaxID=149040 RepID=A0A132B5R7_MOLSC|nr:DNA repair protein-like protein Rad7 [Mollisia scopiformis]KUJ07756.1 DNA repair protein-like protein Rad7 [Mollisia scopiformis]
MSNGPPPPPNPPQRGARAIRGPQSALTDFLASHNISANQIRQDANARRAAALASQQNGEDESNAPSPVADPEPAKPRRKETKAQEAKRKKEEEKAIAKIKASKQFQKRRRQYGSDDDVTDEDEAARTLFQESMASLPGQMENCEICEKRFSVTAYSRAGPDGGLLCPKCSKELDKEEGAAKKKRKTQQGRARRQLQSNLLDGIYPGAKDLTTLCIETLAKNVDMADSFGDLPAPLIDKLSGILCKRRLMDSTILDLFLRPGADSVTVYDGSKLSSDDYIRIFQIVPTIKHLRLRNAVQFKNKVMDHLLGTTVELESLSLLGANLIDDERWDQFLTEKGSHLRELKVYWTDGHFGNEQLELLPKTCPDLRRLKVVHNQKVTDEGIAHIADLANLKYLTLEITTPRVNTTPKPYVQVINSIGAGLRTLSLTDIPYVDDSVLGAIHDSCKDLSKLRLVDNETFTDEGFANLFTEWRNPPLTFLDLHKCRHIDAAEPRENPDSIGLGSLGFQALMAHSGESLKHLNVHSCRHISLEAFESVFAADKTYPELLTIDLSFCQQVNDFVAGSIFRSCPKLKTLKVFGNFGVRDVRVPKGKILIGVPNALGMQIEGTEDGEGRTI